MTTTDKQQLLTHTQVMQKVQRIAFEIYENNFEDAEIVLAGVWDRGYWLAELLKKQIETISPLSVTLVRIDIDKLNPHQSPVLFDVEKSVLQSKTVVVVDDVLNTGRTLAYGLSPFFGVQVKKLQLAVIVDRGHHLYPIAADYVGYTLSTTLTEHIEVKLDEDGFGVYLH
ncbi:MAG: phosphoribosyltransferase family protein [Spirosomataceae bacterium]